MVPLGPIETGVKRVQRCDDARWLSSGDAHHRRHLARRHLAKEGTWQKKTPGKMREARMKLSIALAAPALLATGFMTASTEKASAVVYCTYIGYPANCVVRP